jgi:hypothetical protein
MMMAGKMKMMMMMMMMMMMEGYKKKMMIVMMMADHSHRISSWVGKQINLHTIFTLPGHSLT